MIFNKFSSINEHDNNINTLHIHSIETNCLIILLNLFEQALLSDTAVTPQLITSSAYLPSSTSATKQLKSYIIGSDENF